MKPKYNTSKFRSQAVGASLVTAITICFTSSAFAVDNFWVGGTSTDWNTATNWSLGRVPINPNGAPTGDTFDDAVINTTPANVATISANVPTPRDFRVGQGAATNGTVNHTAGNASTGGGNWMFVGREGGTGTYNLANTNTSGGTFTTFGTGSGSMTVPGGARLYIGGRNGDGGGNGTFNINTSGTLTVASDIAVGASGGTGTLNLDAGLVTAGGWNFIGKNEGADGGTGTLRMSGGTMTNTGSRTYVGLGNSVGTVEMTGGTYNNNNNNGDCWFAVGVLNNANASVSTVNMSGTAVINGASLVSVGGASEHGNADGSSVGAGKGTLNMLSGTPLLNATGELWVGQATGSVGNLNLSAGTIQSGSWIAVGRSGGNGTVTMTGGTWNKTGGGTSFIIGASGPGTLDQSGGTVNVTGGDTWMGEGGTANFTLHGTGIFNATVFQVARNGGSTGNVNLDGGTLQVSRIIGGGGAEHIHFNGTQVKATGIEPNFINGIDAGQAFVDAGGMLIETNFAIGSTQDFNGVGGVTKSGTGTLTLSGSNTFSGANTVSAGKLVVNTRPTATAGSYTVETNATLGIKQTSNTFSLTTPDATFASGSKLDIDLGNLAGNPTAAPLAVTGTLTLSGPVTINVADTLPAVGSIPLVTYVGATSVAANFTLGTLPNGVVATLDTTTTPGLVSLVVTSASLPLWKGYVDGVWDTVTNNWFEQVTGTANSKYADPAPVLFNDTATGPGGSLVSLPGTVSPSKVTFSNSSLGYFLTGAGKITGPGSLLKQGTASLSITTANNDYTGTTTLEGGSTSVSKLADGGSPSSIGASGAAASNLVLSGGTLNYTGGAVSINRGFTLSAANSTLSTANSLTMSGPVVTTIGSFIKAGGGNLTLTNPGANSLGTAGLNARVNGGTLTLDGTLGGQTNTVLAELWTGTTPDVAADLVLTNTSLTVGSWIAIGLGNGSTGTTTKFTATGSTVQSTGFSAGYDGGIALNNSIQIVSLTNTAWTNSGQTNLAESLGANSSLTLAGASTYTTPGETRMAIGTNTTANLTIGGTSAVSTGRLRLALGTGSVANVTVQDSGSLTKTGSWLSIGDGNNGNGTMTVKNSGQVTADGDFNVSDVGTSTGTLTIQDSAIVTSTGNGVYVAKNDGTTGTINLNGGRLIAKGVFGNGSTGVGTVNFNGGVLEAGTGVNPVFMSGIDNVVIKVGGATIDTAANTVAINQVIGEDAAGRTLTKVGTGTLLFNSLNTYTGTTTVNNGTLGGTGGTSGPVSVGATGNLNPGVTTGTFYAESLLFTAGGKLTIDVAATPDSVNVINNLNLANAELVLNGTPTLQVYVIASYGSRSGTFTTLPTLPAGYSIDYNYAGGTQVALVRAQSAYELWIDTYFPGETNPAIVGKLADPDGDGSANVVEFALGGEPNNGSNNPKVYSIIGDSSDAGTANELLMTIAVRTATPAFAGSPSPSASLDGVDIVVQGSLNLGTFTSPTAVVSPVTTGIPASPPTGYEYRTFSLTASDGVPNAGFLRAQVVGTP